MKKSSKYSYYNINVILFSITKISHTCHCLSASQMVESCSSTGLKPSLGSTPTVLKLMCKEIWFDLLVIEQKLAGDARRRSQMSPCVEIQDGSCIWTKSFGISLLTYFCSNSKEGAVFLKTVKENLKKDLKHCR